MQMDREFATRKRKKILPGINKAEQAAAAENCIQF